MFSKFWIFLEVFVVALTLSLLTTNYCQCETNFLLKKELSNIDITSVRLHWLVCKENKFQMKNIFYSESKDMCNRIMTALRSIKGPIGSHREAIGILSAGILFLNDNQGINHKIGVSQAGYVYGMKSTLNYYFTCKPLNIIIMEMITQYALNENLYMPADLRKFLSE